MIRPIEYVASVADLIVNGEIVAAANGVYLFKVDETLKGKSAAVIRVQQFNEWTCDIRYAKAAKGQRLILFLKKVNDQLEIVNGSTGEIPLINDSVTLTYESYSPTNYTRPYQLNAKEFSEGIKGFINLFALTGNNKEPGSVCFRQNGSDGELQKFIAGNSFSKWMYEKVQRNYTIVKS
ncbi:hypothetical protein U0035_06975 [Niabella yanshanensis]|uniref:Uncharacterized protein n=1 Tax=Niabella yanshanensis TaxID=577386 RepID=A0ABZ0W9N7_9BACT|nr:hypothetical protein [Niabella yanshanensis]WQD39891.1 hypothetical protein U0035_06975 [Niabella yanshanensis]